MENRFPLASTAALIADPARAAMLTALLSGRSLPAGELARIAGVSPQSASMHLSQMINGGFLTVGQQGRHRYYRIARPEVAQAIEALGVISTPRSYKSNNSDQALRYARTCYDHLAGELAVQLATAFEERGLITPDGEKDFALTRQGERFLADWGIDTAALRRSRRSFARRCLDWTQRRDHLAGALGAAIYQKLIDLRWLAHQRKGRGVSVTLQGRQQLQSLLGATNASDSASME